jgi:predicted transcriptional regulator
MNVLLSIKPRFAELIFSGIKKYEFRKTIFSRSDINKVIVYASSPISKVIGEFEIAEIISADPAALWKMTKAHAGISRSFFFWYFANRNCGYAIKVKKCTIYESPLCIQTFFGIKPPQSFAYVAN